MLQMMENNIIINNFVILENKLKNCTFFLFPLIPSSKTLISFKYIKVINLIPIQIDQLF